MIDQFEIVDLVIYNSQLFSVLLPFKPGFSSSSRIFVITTGFRVRVATMIRYLNCSATKLVFLKHPYIPETLYISFYWTYVVSYTYEFP